MLEKSHMWLQTLCMICWYCQREKNPVDMQDKANSDI